MRSSSSSSSIVRPNEHLAVLLAKHLWTPDSSTPHCENLYCHVPFNLFERKHHCRKCGGVFCGACSSRTTTLLDTSNLTFLQPPRNVPITAFESQISPIVDARVCDDCWDQIHGYPTTPHTPDVTRPSFKRVLVNPISMLIFPTSSPSSPIVSSPSSTASADSSDLSIPASLKRRPTNSHNSSASSINTSSSTESQSKRTAKRSTVQVSQQPLPQELERSYGELDAYPLRQASVLCKASGGGRWVPKESPPMDGYRPPIPGAKAPFELQMERDELLERQRRSNPVVKDGAFQYRFPKEPEPVILSRSPYNLSTF